MNISQFAEQHGLSVSQTNMAKAMLIAGVPEPAVLNAVKRVVEAEDQKHEELTSNSLGCPRCGSLMKIVTLADGRNCKYCMVDRVTLPM